MTAEASELVARYLDRSGRLRQFPTKRAAKNAVLTWLTSMFEQGRRCRESEVNEILGRAHSFCDAALLRRALCDASQLVREADGSAYWRP
jgi:hypothetical protein